MKLFWVGVASREHVLKVVEDGFCQFSHGSAAAVERVQPGDGIAYYSPRDQMRGGETIQAFTAIGVVADGDPDQATQSGQFRPNRRKVAYADAKDAPVMPLLGRLTFTQGRTYWGQAFRRGFSPSSRPISR